MTRICRITRHGQALAVGWACCMVGCQQLHTNSAQNANRSLISSQAADGKMTAAQQADMQIAMGRVSQKQGDLAGAMAAYSEALKRDHKCAEAYVRLAIVHDQQGEFRESAEMYRKALKLAPGNPEIYCDMGYSLYLQRRWAEAEMNARQALALDAKHLRAHNNLALLLARDGRLDDALAEFRKGGSDRASAHANLAFVLTMERRWDDARKHYQLALEADPSSTELKARLRQLDTLIAKLEPGQGNERAKEDARLVKTSSTIAQPQRRAPARDDAPGYLPAQITTQKRSISESGASSSAALVASATTKVTSGASGGQPVASIRPPRTAESLKTMERRIRDRPHGPIPPLPKFRDPMIIQSDGNRPATSSSVIPPPRIRVPLPDRSRADEPPGAPPRAPVTTNVPKEGSAAIMPHSAETPPIPPLESAR